ncbi:MAG: hypothetical protein ACWA45_06910 [Flavobacteriales bacterium]
MALKSFIDCERKNLEKLQKLQLPNSFKKVGWVIFSISIIALFLTTKGTYPKMIVKYTLLLGLLLVSVSKEKMEDELIKNLRMQSVTFAFIAAVLITITNPLISYLLNFVLSTKQDPFSGVGDWQILWLLLSIQIFYFEYLKKMYQ